MANLARFGCHQIRAKQKDPRYHLPLLERYFPAILASDVENVDGAHLDFR
jgi:hypothetical protein